MTYTGSIKNRFGPQRQYTSFGITVNSINYFGDLSPEEAKISTDLSLTRPGIGVTAAHRFAPALTFQVDFLYSRIHGSDITSADKSDLANGVFRYNRNLSFRNAIKELSLAFTLDLIANRFLYSDRSFYTPYLFAGIAIFHHNPKAQVPENDLGGNRLENAGDWVNLRDLGTEGQYANLEAADFNYGNSPYKLIQPAIPIGLGARLKVGDNFDFSAEFGLRFLFTDYIDDVSKNFVDLGVFGNNELARSLSYRSNEIATPSHQYVSERDGQTYSVVLGYGEENKGYKRGNSTNRDFYTVFKIRLAYILPNQYAKAKHR